MKLLAILAYHRVGQGKHSNSFELLESHFSAIKKNFPVVMPGEPLQKGRNICLTFDDGTFDFYHYVFPLLKKYDLRALLAVPTHYIMESTKLAPVVRLSVPYTLAMQEGITESKVPFCTWEELDEMVRSGHVEIAAHSHLHCNLTFSFVDLEREIIKPKRMIEERLNCPVRAFVYPFGRTTDAVHSYVKEHYDYGLRLGFGYNFGWENEKRPLLRITCDQMAHQRAPFTLSAHLRYLTKALMQPLLK